MMRTPIASSLLAVAAVVSTAPAQRREANVVVPAVYGDSEAPGTAFWAFSPFASRHQLLLGSSHLTELVDRPITAIQVRRNASGSEALAAGVVRLRLIMSHPSQAPAQAGETFAANRGPTESIVFDGVVALPAAPSTPPLPAPWAAPHSVTIDLDQPFVYTGGTLCIESETMAPSSALPAPWWPIDAHVERAGGSSTPIGEGCLDAIAGIDDASLRLGASGALYLRGTITPGSSGVCLLGLSATHFAGLPLPLDLAPVGAAGCWLHIAPAASLIATAEALPEVATGLANVRLALPLAPVMAGSTFYSQWAWIDGGANPLGLTFSAGSQIMVGGLSQLRDACWIESGNLTSSSGWVMRGRFPVLRLMR
ncbi:MAG: hypothetical protein AAF628_28765 [Planctomycetota bacterium]